MYRYAVPLTFFLFAWQAVRATPAHLVMTVHALTFGVLSATSKVVQGQSNGWAQGVWVGKGRGGRGACAYLCVCMCVCVCMCIYTHTHIHILVHTHTQMYELVTQLGRRTRGRA